HLAWRRGKGKELLQAYYLSGYSVAYWIFWVRENWSQPTLEHTAFMPITLEKLKPLVVMKYVGTPTSKYLYRYSKYFKLWY
uniref:Uncharacterized protein n=1 Tax=Electrophorus electricus TaxID=8005 RepID=A0AAY5E9Q1_ELEEL